MAERPGWGVSLQAGLPRRPSCRGRGAWLMQPPGERAHQAVALSERGSHQLGCRSFTESQGKVLSCCAGVQGNDREAIGFCGPSRLSPRRGCEKSLLSSFTIHEIISFWLNPSSPSALIVCVCVYPLGKAASTSCLLSNPFLTKCYSWPGVGGEGGGTVLLLKGIDFTGCSMMV